MQHMTLNHSSLLLLSLSQPVVGVFLASVDHHQFPAIFCRETRRPAWLRSVRFHLQLTEQNCGQTGDSPINEAKKVNARNVSRLFGRGWLFLDFDCRSLSRSLFSISSHLVSSCMMDGMNHHYILYTMTDC